MAKYEVTCKCGHTITVNLTGSWEERKNSMEYYESSLCPDCAWKEKKARREQQIEAALEKTKELNLPELTDARTDDQFRKANLYRMSYIENAKKFLDELKDKETVNVSTDDRVSNKADKETLQKAIEYGIKHYTTASFWTSHKDCCETIRKAIFGDDFQSFSITEHFVDDYKEDIENNNKSGDTPTPLELTVTPEDNKKPNIVHFIIDRKTIKIDYPIKDDDFIKVVKNNYYQWGISTWQRKIDKWSGTIDDRIANVGYHLLQAGFTVRFLNVKQRDMAVNRTYEVEQTRWVTLKDGTFSISWKGYNGELYTAARKIPGSKWISVGSYVSVPYERYEKLQRFAVDYGFSLSDKVKEVIEEQEREKEENEIKKIEEDENAKKVEEAKNSISQDRPLTFKEIRERTGLTQAGFARKYGIPKRSCENWEMGERVPSPYLRDLLARVAKEDYLFNWNNFERKLRGEKESQIFYHYGEEVTVQCSQYNVLENWLASAKEKGVEPELLPILVPKDNVTGYLIDVFYYEINNFPRYSIINRTTGFVYTVKKLPVDMDMNALIEDVDSQYSQKTEPWKIKSKFDTLYRRYFYAASEKVHNDEISDLDKQILPAYDLKAKKIGMKDTDEWDTEDYPFEKAKDLLTYKIMYELLEKDGYDYEYLKVIAELDHHDVPDYRGDLKTLREGRDWENYIGKELEEIKK